MNTSLDDALGLLEEKARRLDLEERATRQLELARTKILLGRDARSAFFTVLVLGLEPRVDWEQPTAATDGKFLHYNPEFLAGLPLPETMGLCAHEGLHVGLGHHARRGVREPVLANIAMDLEINPLLLEAGYTLPAGALIPGRPLGRHRASGLPPGVAEKLPGLPAGLTFEEYYALLDEPAPPPQPPEPPGEDEQEGDQDQNQPGQNLDPGGCGGVQDAAPDEAGLRQAEALARVQLYQAEAASKSRGALPGGLARLVEQTRQPVVDWRSVLREFVTRYAKSDYNWLPPNRRFAHTGLYLPSFHSRELGRLLVAVDTSGSIGAATMEVFAGELEGIIECYSGVELTILYHDCEVLKVQEWRPEEGPLKLEPVGGGGTSHVPVFDWLAQHQDEEPWACLVALTDCYTEYPDQAPEIPVLWAVVGNQDAKPPFGQLVEVSG